MAVSPVRREKDAGGIVTITFDAPGAPVNTMTEAWQAAFTETVEFLEREKTLTKGVILASAKKTFFAGAELKDVLKFGANDGPQVFRWIEAAKKPTPNSIAASTASVNRKAADGFASQRYRAALVKSVSNRSLLLIEINVCLQRDLQ
jgi:enoyl-CoA hydratase/carnithine racemase